LADLRLAAYYYYIFFHPVFVKAGKYPEVEINDLCQEKQSAGCLANISKWLSPDVATDCLVYSQASIFILLFLISVIAATADTWATEVGVLSKSAPRLILSFKKVPQGTSGGVSILGTVAAFSGALIVAILGLLIFQYICHFNLLFGTFY